MVNKKVGFVLFAVIFFASAFLSFAYFSHAGSSSAQAKKSSVTPSVDPELAAPKTEECPINGQMMTKTQKNKWITRRPMGVAIENSVDARPQSGLSYADAVYEAVAEGGITRFLAIYYCQDAPFIGPVRSARMHFMTMLREYGEYPLYAHVGGANCDQETGSGCANGAKADALGTLRKLGWDSYNDLNQFGVPFPYYWRDYERLPGVATEHTVYSSTSKLWDFAKTKRELTNVDADGVSWDKNFTSWKFQDDAKAADRGTTNKISFGFWTSFSDSMGVVWNYDAKSNSYLRENGGKAHVDKDTGKQLTAKNIIIMFADESNANDGYDGSGAHILYNLKGTGDALIFQNGKAVKGEWSKASPEDRTTYTDANGKEVKMVRGQVFVEILPTGNKVTY